ncbi:MAG: hypothetical protein VW405_11135 [Rhodospirillaceae bacterium]
MPRFAPFVVALIAAAMTAADNAPRPLDGSADIALPFAAVVLPRKSGPPFS